MVHLNRIYTKTGDDGTTALGTGARVPKESSRIEAYGAVDELNAHVGVALELVGEPEERDHLTRIQHDLFDLGADLCMPFDPDESEPHLRTGAQCVARLERWIDAANEGLADLESFVLPGGTPLAAAYHVARTVCRRAERRVVALAEDEPEAVNPLDAVYLNRLSDLFFVLSRKAAGPHERLWVRGGGDAP